MLLRNSHQAVNGCHRLRAQSVLSKMYLTSLSVVCVLSLVSGNVLYFKPQHQQDDVVMEFDQVPEDGPDIIVYDPVEGHESRVPMKVEAPVNERPFRSVMCPDGMSECQNDNTCCKLSNGHYGCCPFPDAVCCSDMKHCCRQGFTCNLSKGRCEQGNSYMPLISKLPASKPINQQNKKTGSPRLSEAQMIADPLEICPGGEHACQGGYSCCINTNGTYSCCGYSPALCCEDKVHCCPANYKCLSTGLCEDRNGFQLPRSRKVEATNIKVKANIVCPDKTQCAAGQTCCMKGVNIYGCCPLQKAVCCADRKHCCPFGYKCGTKVGTCMQGYHIIDLSVENNHDISREITTDLKVVAEEIMQSSVICPDKSQCMTGQTCCQGISGSYGCCPVPNAVCCTDKKHCCPEGHKCETSVGKCVKGDHLMDWLEKESNSMSITYQVSGQHLCPDHRSICNPGQTCCKLNNPWQTFKYGCCPLSKGVCCGDKDGHCCPMGYICNVQERNCRKEGTDEVIQWLTKMKINSLSVRNVVCPDGRSECPTGNTCCLGEEGKYGCCPQPNAVCCSDKKHCCQQNTKCDASSHRCVHTNGLLTEWFEKIESQPVARLYNNICPNPEIQCPDRQTCCPALGSGYGCCPSPNAVCCADKKHCCPNGYTCETGSGKCTRNNAISIEWLEKTESRPVGSSAVDVICPDGHSECKSGSTCCLIEGNKYGCCPVPNAVCCADKKHCCPNGYTCETGSGKCTRNNAISIEWLEKTESRPVGSSAVDVICPDGHSECKSGSTCCLIEGNKYGCCPVPNAVCCADKKHCCPNGYTCETGSGKCTRNNAISIEWLEKTESRPVGSSAVDVICPDGHSECKSGSTCCLIEGNKYGCCPVPNAVCCADKKHCCPNGYTCETGSGKCTRNNAISIEWLEKTESRPVGSSAVDVICPDGHSECKSGSTCCLIEGNKYGCCPVPNAVCCADKKHCCPNGYTCETGSGKCTRNNAISIEWLEKTESRPVGSSAVDVICPDGHSECKSGSTCCLIEGNKYGCCPVPNAVCCADKKHCCPNGYTCETGSGKCTRNNAISIEWLEKTESRPVGSSAVDVICPDGHSECKSGSTCCLIEGNKYGCCPVPNAVCCADKKHCCPNGYTCETGSGKCTRNNAISIEWLEKTESRPVGSSAVDVICPDGHSECKSGSTCCLIEGNKYGCCPVPNAVCCADKKHCCPNGYTCETGSGKCTRNNAISIEWLEKTESRPVGSSAVDVICPDGHSECKSGSTCCLIEGNKYGCCPVPNAVCCADKKHCCPNGYTCETGSGKCTRNNAISIEWLEKTESRPVGSSAVDVICPDGHSECKSGSTCCLIEGNKYGCCPVPNAVCCADKKHCCPNGYTCETGSGKCTRNNAISIEWLEKTESRPVGSSAVDVICPDGHSECKSGSTCCLIEGNKYGCCPVPNAVCCADKKHCCPNGYTCETGSGKCTRNNAISIEWLEKTESRPVGSSAVDVICPDGHSECKSGSTCCLIEGNKYGCCPVPNAVCCADKKHCCPNGYTCETGSGKCTRNNAISIEWLEKTESRPVGSSAVDVICPDGHSECKSGSTCCLIEGNKYGCCPVPNAVCCADKKHCCPNGYTCETGSGKCTRNNAISIEWLEKTESRPVGSSAVDVICPDGHSECKSGSTCCLIEGNKYGCCPVPNAVCCADKKHCCPNGYTCETGSGKCTRNNAISIEWLEKTESRPVGSSAVDVICPDGHSECKSGSTCCLIEGNKYGCCPVPNAVCCADKKHCCPNGYTCETGSGKCTRNNAISIEWLEKTESRPVGSSAVDVICPDGHSECKSGSTCCLIEGNKYGCCPVPNAVCCADKKHCCPNGYTCETGSGKCTRNNAISIEWLEKTESRPVGSSAVDVICPDGHSECKSGSTCCLIEGNKYGCCPVPNAVCCADKKHCCPNGYTCETGSGKCTRNNAIAIEWLEKTESRPVGSSAVDVICPDGHSECKSGSTCCLIEGNKYGCCPVPNAVCCADKKHCCPNGYTCETGSGKCTRNNAIAIEWLEKTESRPVGSSAVDVICPDGHSECKSGSTCCLIEGNKYGCCPVPNAVCCADKKHCCPNGYTCETGSGKCTRNNAIAIEWLEKTESRPVGSSAVDVICPDGHSECKSGSTCCLIEGNKYGCCPVPNAVCCADKKHCCPNGYTCETGSGKCTRNNAIAIEWLEKTESRPVGSSAVDVICPDGHSECKSGSTCCLIEGNKYGCCPVPNAVCCADKKHCCPNGYTCETGSGKCTRNNAISIEWLEKTESRPVGSSAVDVICPDGHSECKSGSTCCLIEGNKYGCCPVPNAVCCADKKHCCPNGYTCETGSGKCTRNNAISIEWLEKTESRPVASTLSIICPDMKTECPSGNTCCLDEEGTYACCPRPNAVCCSDKKHCCPENTECDTSSGKCISENDLSMDWLQMHESVLIQNHYPISAKIVPAISVEHDSSSIDCPGGGSCPSDNTCCKNSSGNYGCCSYAKAICCPDGKYCCPHGYICDTEPMICRMPEGSKRQDFNTNLFLQHVVNKHRQRGGNN